MEGTVRRDGMFHRHQGAMDEGSERNGAVFGDVLNDAELAYPGEAEAYADVVLEETDSASLHGDYAFVLKAADHRGMNLGEHRLMHIGKHRLLYATAAAGLRMNADEAQ